MTEREWWSWAKEDLETKPVEIVHDRIEEIVKAYRWHKPPEQVRVMLWNLVLPRIWASPRFTGMGATKKPKKKPAPPPPPERREPTYWESVRSMAEDVKENCPDPKDDECRHQYIHESVDGSAWIIYYDNNETVLNETNNEPDDREVEGMTGPGKGWKDMRMVAAYLAMEADVWEELRELDEKSEED